MRRALFVASLTLTCVIAVQTATAVEYPLTPDPAACDAEPIDIDALVARAATTYPAATPRAVPSATGASPSLEDELMAVVFGSVACTNANRPLEALSYFTEDYLLQRISDEPAVTLGHLQAAATRRPEPAAPEDRVTIETVEAATVWPDDAVSAGNAEVVVRWSSGGESTLVGLRFRQVDGDWKIYEVLAGDAAP